MRVALRIPWPKKGDRLFKSDIDWKNNACLNFSHDMSECYILGYKLGGDILVKYVKRKKSNQDLLVYPIGFLYRQYLELRLKDIIELGFQLYNIEGRHKKHDILQLWIDAKLILKKAWPQGDTKDLAIIERCIKEYVKIDPFSQSFRYTKDIKGNNSLEGILRINLRNLAEVMNRISSLLDGSSMGLSDLLDSKRGMESDYR